MDHFDNRCPFPVGWMMNRGFLFFTAVNDDRWYTKPSPLFFPKGHSGWY